MEWIKWVPTQPLYIARFNKYTFPINFEVLERKKEELVMLVSYLYKIREKSERIWLFGKMCAFKFISYQFNGKVHWKYIMIVI